MMKSTIWKSIIWKSWINKLSESDISAKENVTHSPSGTFRISASESVKRFSLRVLQGRSESVHQNQSESFRDVQNQCIGISQSPSGTFRISASESVRVLQGRSEPVHKNIINLIYQWIHFIQSPSGTFSPHQWKDNQKRLSLYSVSDNSAVLVQITQAIQSVMKKDTLPLFDF